MNTLTEMLTNKKRVFLGGTCNNSTWRDELVDGLEIDYFNPVVEDWTPECMAEEIRQRETCDIVLYTITPEMTGVFSVAEVTDDSNKRPEKTMMCILDEQNGRYFNKHQLKSLVQVGRMVEENGGKVFNSLDKLRIALNSF